MREIQENKRDELGRFLPGVSGNLAGRGKGPEDLTKALRATVNPQELAAKLLELAMGGNVKAIMYIFDRLDGKPKQHIEMSNDKDAAWLELILSIKADVDGKTA